MAKSSSSKKSAKSSKPAAKPVVISKKTTKTKPAAKTPVAKPAPKVAAKPAPKVAAVAAKPAAPAKPTAKTAPSVKANTKSAKAPVNPLAHIPSVANGSATLIYARPIKGNKPVAKPVVSAPVKHTKSPADIQVHGRPMGIVPAPIPADAKPRKNQAGFNAKDLEKYRQLLLEKRAELLGDMRSMEHEALRSTSGSNLSNLPVHMADMGTDNYEQEFTLGLVEKDRLLLREINVALQKILDGSYGICEGTGKPISAPRLEVRPWTRYSIEYARKIEQGLVRPARRDISG